MADKHSPGAFDMETGSNVVMPCGRRVPDISEILLGAFWNAARPFPADPYNLLRFSRTRRGEAVVDTPVGKAESPHFRGPPEVRPPVRTTGSM
jgi:hypothetical protein